MDLRTMDITLHGWNLRTTDKYICLRTCNICNKYCTYTDMVKPVRGKVWRTCSMRYGLCTWGKSMEKDVRGGFRVGQDMDSWKRVGMEWMDKVWTWEDGIRFQFSYFFYIVLYSFCLLFSIFSHICEQLVMSWQLEIPTPGVVKSKELSQGMFCMDKGLG